MHQVQSWLKHNRLLAEVGFGRTNCSRTNVAWSCRSMPNVPEQQQYTCRCQGSASTTGGEHAVLQATWATRPTNQSPVAICFMRSAND